MSHGVFLEEMGNDVDKWLARAMFRVNTISEWGPNEMLWQWIKILMKSVTAAQSRLLPRDRWQFMWELLDIVNFAVAAPLSLEMVIMLLLWFHQPQAWLYRSGFARFSNTRFSLDSIDDHYVHLTNVAVQKTAPEYDPEKVICKLHSLHVVLNES